MKTLGLRLSILAAIHWWVLVTATGAPFTFTSTGNLAQGRTLHTSTLLQNGKVLVAGGANPGIVGTAELYDPLTGTWAATGNLVTPREAHTATMLHNGAVLVTGGVGTTNNVLTSAELYDPATGKWSATKSSLTNARYAHTATLLPNGKVLVAGGFAATGFVGPAGALRSGDREVDSNRQPHHGAR